MAAELALETRADRRKAKTRAALLRAAQLYMAERNTAVAVLDITQRADVGLGTFYNHFESKDELFDAAVEDAMEAHAIVLDLLVPEDDDPARVFAQRFRLSGRMHRQQPELSRVVLSRAASLLGAELGFAPRARRDIERAIDAGRFTMQDVGLAMALVYGAAMALGQLLHDDPARDATSTADDATESVLVMLGMTRAQARKISHGPLPDLPEDLATKT